MGDAKTDSPALSAAVPAGLSSPVAPVLTPEELKALLDAATDAAYDPKLDEVVGQIAKTGRAPYPWSYLQTLVILLFKATVGKLEVKAGKKSESINGEATSVWIERVITGVNSFKRPPWTFQRMCELLSHAEPGKVFRSTEVFILSVAKLICGIRERGTVGDSFGLSSEIAPISERSKLPFQLPFFMAPRLESGLTRTAPAVSMSVAPVSPTGASPSSAVAASVSAGVATVFPKSSEAYVAGPKALDHPS